jgi:hypothetical protein
VLNRRVEIPDSVWHAQVGIGTGAEPWFTVLPVGQCDHADQRDLACRPLGSETLAEVEIVTEGHPRVDRDEVGSLKRNPRQGVLNGWERLAVVTTNRQYLLHQFVAIRFSPGDQDASHLCPPLSLWRFSAVLGTAPDRGFRDLTLSQRPPEAEQRQIVHVRPPATEVVDGVHDRPSDRHRIRVGFHDRKEEPVKGEGLEVRI